MRGTPLTVYLSRYIGADLTRTEVDVLYVLLSEVFLTVISTSEVEIITSAPDSGSFLYTFHKYTREHKSFVIKRHEFKPKFKLAGLY